MAGGLVLQGMYGPGWGTFWGSTAQPLMYLLWTPFVSIERQGSHLSGDDYSQSLHLAVLGPHHSIHGQAIACAVVRDEIPNISTRHAELYTEN